MFRPSEHFDHTQDQPEKAPEQGSLEDSGLEAPEKKITEPEKLAEARLNFFEKTQKFCQEIEARILELQSPDFAEQWAKVKETASSYRRARSDEEKGHKNKDPDYAYLNQVRTTWHNRFVEALLKLSQIDYRQTGEPVEWAIRLGLANNPKEGAVRMDLGNLAVALAILLEKSDK